MKQLRIALGSLVAAGALEAFAFTTNVYVWTGAKSACWTNAANWTVGGAVAARCPGVAAKPGMTTDELTAASVAEFTNELTVAEFSGASARTTVDLDGLHLVGGVRVTGATVPAYTLGTSSNQVLRFMCTVNGADQGNAFRITSDVTNMPVVAARFGAYQVNAVSGSTVLTWWGAKTGYVLANENAQPFVLAAVGGYASPDRTTAYYGIFLRGRGPITLAASPTDDPAKISCCLSPRAPATMTVRGTVENYRRFGVEVGNNLTYTLHIPEGSLFRFASAAGSSYPTGWYTYYCSFFITGTGLVEGVDDMYLYTYSHFYPRYQCDIPNSISFTSYPSYINLPEGLDAVIASATHAEAIVGGRIPLTVIRSNHASSMTLKNLAGQAWPDWLRLDGAVGRILSDGRLVSAAPATDTSIAAKGDTVPNDASKAVGITTEGSGANTKLASAATAVRSLVHVAACDATVAVGAGERLTAAEGVIRADGAGALAIGETAGVGSLVAPFVRNDDVYGTLTVRTSFDGPCLALTNAHQLAFEGGVSSPIPLTMNEGDLSLTGAKPYNFSSAVLGKFVNESTWGVDPMVAKASVDIHDTTLVIGDGREGFAIGRDPTVYWRTWAMTSNYVAATVRNATVYSTVPMGVSTNKESSYDSTIGVLSVGNTTHASLEILEGSVLSNRFLVGGIAGDNSLVDDTVAYRCQRGFGGVYQRGGDVTMIGAAQSDYGGRYGSTIGTLTSYSIGFWELSGGTLRNTRIFTMMCGASGEGVNGGLLHLKGGAFAADGQGYLGVGNGVRAEIYQTGGTASFGGNVTLARSWSSGSRAYVTLDGADAAMTVDGYILFAPSMTAKEAGYSTSVNLNAGVLTVKGFGTRNVETAADTWRCVTFGGGTLRVGRADQDLFTYPKDSYGYTPADHAYVFDGGATIDTAGLNASSSVAFEGPSGGGVTGVEGFVPYREVCPSPIRIEGDGVGAQAVMLYDSATQTATGIRITCPGIGYTYATAKYDNGYYNGQKAARITTLACTVAPNANTGSLTKTGEGTLTLNAANTYGGATVLAGGTLAINVPNAYPTGSALVPGEGVLRVTKTGALPAAIAVDASDLDRTQTYESIVYDEIPTAIPKFTFFGSRVTWRARLLGRKIRFASRTGLTAIVH